MTTHLILLETGIEMSRKAIIDTTEVESVIRVSDGENVTWLDDGDRPRVRFTLEAADLDDFNQAVDELVLRLAETAPGGWKIASRPV